MCDFGGENGGDESLEQNLLNGFFLAQWKEQGV